MREPCHSYTMLLPVRQQEKLKNLSREEGVSMAVLVKRGIDLVLSGRYKEASNNSHVGEN